MIDVVATREKQKRRRGSRREESFIGFSGSWFVFSLVFIILHMTTRRRDPVRLISAPVRNNIRTNVERVNKRRNLRLRKTAKCLRFVCRWERFRGKSLESESCGRRGRTGKKERERTRERVCRSWEGEEKWREGVAEERRGLGRWVAKDGWRGRGGRHTAGEGGEGGRGREGWKGVEGVEGHECRGGRGKEEAGKRNGQERVGVGGDRCM